MFDARSKQSPRLLILSCALATLGACDDDTDAGTGTDTGGDSMADSSTTGSSSTGGGSESAGSTGGADPGFGTPEDLTIANNLLGEIAGFSQWPSFADKVGVVASVAPHGPFARYYLNSVAHADPVNMADGSIVIKQNLATQDPAAVDSVTLMRRIAGYNPGAGDWFWLKLDSQGNIAQNDAGTHLAGRVAPCIACHAKADGADFVFEN